MAESAAIATDTATMPPMVTKPMTNRAAMIWPASTEIVPSEILA